jgi:hypothetical protein
MYLRSYARVLVASSDDERTRDETICDESENLQILKYTMV